MGGSGGSSAGHSDASTAENGLMTGSFVMPCGSNRAAEAGGQDGREGRLW